METEPHFFQSSHSFKPLARNGGDRFYFYLYIFGPWHGTGKSCEPFGSHKASPEVVWVFGKVVR